MASDEIIGGGRKCIRCGSQQHANCGESLTGDVMPDECRHCGARRGEHDPACVIALFGPDAPLGDARSLVSSILDEPCPEGWDHASGGSYTRTLWAPDVETANEISRALATKPTGEPGD